MVETTPRGDGGGRASRLRRGAFRAGVWFAFVGGLVATIVGQHGWIDLERRRAEVAEARLALEAQRERVAAEAKAVSALEHDPLARERLARERLGLAAPGEYVFLLPSETAPPSP